MRLIDVDGLMTKINAWDESARNGTNPNCKNGNEYEAAMDICIIVEESPIIDAVPVVHSWWEDCSNGWSCGNCHHDMRSEYPYCPWCGARMDGHREGGDA